MHDDPLTKQIMDLRDSKWIERTLKGKSKVPQARRYQLAKLISDTPAILRMSRTGPDPTESAAAEFDQLSDAEITELWSTLFPNLAPYAERAWRTSGQIPYSSVSLWSPFRAGSDTGIVREQRADFFLNLTQSLSGLDPTPEWLAAWVPHFGWEHHRPSELGWLLATVLNDGGSDADAVRQVLIDSIHGRHEIGRFGHHSITALMNSDSPDDWKIIGDLLLSAQREEGLRQSILEPMVDAHPDAFAFILDLVLEHNLARFSSVVRAYDVWLGMQWAGGSTGPVNEGLRKVRAHLNDEDARRTALQSGEGEDVYFALWVQGYRNVRQGLTEAEAVLHDNAPERRFAALEFIRRTGILPDIIELPVARLMAGEVDDRIRMRCCHVISSMGWLHHGVEVPLEHFQVVAGLFESTPKKSLKLEPILWPWMQVTRERRVVADALRMLAADKPQRMLPYADALNAYHCAESIELVSGTGLEYDPATGRQRVRTRIPLNDKTRPFILRMLVDARSEVHRAAFRAIAKSPLEQDEVDLLASNLHRTSATFRSRALERLSTMPAESVLELADSLLSTKHAKRRAAGLELVESVAKAGEHTDEARALVRSHLDSFKDDPDLEPIATRLLGDASETVTLDDCLGLVPPGSRCNPIEPVHRNARRETTASIECLKSLAKLFLEHAETEIDLPASRDGHWPAKKELLGESFPGPDRLIERAISQRDEALSKLPLREVWMDWYENRGPKLLDDDRFELSRAWLRLHSDHVTDSLKGISKEFSRERSWSLCYSFRSLVDWLPVIHYQPACMGFLVQCIEDRVADIKQKKAERTVKTKNDSRPTLLTDHEAILQLLKLGAPKADIERSLARFAALRLLAMDLGHGVEGPDLESFIAAFDEGLVNEFDFGWLLLSSRSKARANEDFYSYKHSWYGPINEVTSLRLPPAIAQRPALADMARRVRERLIEVELTRGERPGPASHPASLIRHAGSADTLCQLLAALGSDKLVRRDQWGTPTRAYSFSRLIAVTVPAESDTDEQFAALIKQHAIKPAKLLDLAFYAPQWASHIERFLNHPGLEEAAWWIHAHTRQRDYWRQPVMRDEWAAQIKLRSELDADDLEEGAVDVAWFLRVINSLTPDGWNALNKHIKYASSTGGHKRAELFAAAMLGSATTADLTKRIDATRHQDSLRAIGLVPLPKAAKKAAAETLARYQQLMEFKRQSRKFGSQRQASEGLAVRIAMENLARTAGYRDPQRLQWAMEAEAVADLAKGPVSITEAETTVTLSLTDSGAPELTVVKKGKPLKSVPAKLRKHEPIAELRSRVTELRRQASRMRRSLEESMCRGDTFTRDELRSLIEHPMLRPMLERLVFIDANNPAGPLAGYPEHNGALLRDHAANAEAFGSKDAVRIAHPADLFARGDWHDWQKDCFAAERVQPFKQIFREFYPRTDAESDGTRESSRYAGHQVQPSRALALLKQREWVFAPEEGVRKVYHDARFIAELWFEQHFYTPAEVDGLTLDCLRFRAKSDRYKSVALADIPQRIFSETMRDLDLVVSVAHASGINPEASASTIEMRAQLVTHTCRLLGLSNVRINGHHVIIDGTRATYSLHLGSATTSIVPGRMLVIVAVHSQYRGRLFLPFADDDPRTAEVMAKLLLLARDSEIRDPSILSQIGA